MLASIAFTCTETRWLCTGLLRHWRGARGPWKLPRSLYKYRSNLLHQHQKVSTTTYLSNLTYKTNYIQQLKNFVF